MFGKLLRNAEAPGASPGGPAPEVEAETPAVPAPAVPAAPPPATPPPPPPPPPSPLQDFDGAVSGVRSSLTQVKAADSAVVESDQTIANLRTEMEVAQVDHTVKLEGQGAAVVAFNDRIDVLISVLRGLQR